MAKGDSYERKKSKEYSLWWSHGERDDIFWRTSGSGGRATSRAKQGKKTFQSHGDLKAEDPSGIPFREVCVVEFKKGYSRPGQSKLSVLDIIDGKHRVTKPYLLRFWGEITTKASMEGSKEPMLVFERDHHRSCLMIRGRLFNKIVAYCGKPVIMDFRIELKVKVGMIMDTIVIVPLDEFFVWCAPEFFEQEAAKRSVAT